MLIPDWWPIVRRSLATAAHAVFLRAQKRLNSGLSICIFPEGLVPEEHIVLEEFKDGAFKLAINHQIPIVPLTFLDNKKRFSYTFFSGGPGIIRAYIHKFLETKDHSLEYTAEIKENAYSIILKQLSLPNKKSYLNVSF